MSLADLESRGRLVARLVDIEDTDAVVAACADAALVWLESPTNPALEVADIETIAKAAHEAGAYVVVDNTFATPLLQQPIALGADIVVHSATKYLSGHSDVLLGALVTPDEELYGVLKNRRSLTGSVPGAFEAWLAVRGMRTLHLRVERAQANAQALLPRLEQHPAVSQVRYPGFGAIVSIVLDGRARRRPARAQDPAVGPRHVAGRRGVDVRAPSPLEVGGEDHPRGPRADVGRHRGRRGPLGRPRVGPRRPLADTPLRPTPTESTPAPAARRSRSEPDPAGRGGRPPPVVEVRGPPGPEPRNPCVPRQQPTAPGPRLPVDTRGFEARRWRSSHLNHRGSAVAGAPHTSTTGNGVAGAPRTSTTETGAGPGPSAQPISDLVSRARIASIIWPAVIRPATTSST